MCVERTSAPVPLLEKDLQREEGARRTREAGPLADALRGAVENIEHWAAAWIKKSIAEYSVVDRNRRTGALRDIDDQFSILRPDTTVVDLGCFSGGWSQLVIERTNTVGSQSRVIGVDKVRMDPLRYHSFIQGDVTQQDTLDVLEEALRGGKADVVLSDLEPRKVGLKEEDHLASMELCLHATKIMERTLRLGGWFVLKLWYGTESDRLRTYLMTRFEIVRRIRPQAAAEFREVFYVCRNFIGRAPIEEEVQTRGSFSYKREGAGGWGEIRKNE